MYISGCFSAICSASVKEQRLFFGLQPPPKTRILVLFSYSFFLPHTFDLAPMLPLSLPFALFLFFFFNRLHSGIRCVVIVVL